MPNLRVRAAQDARKLNVRDWGLLVELIDPDGKKYNTDIISGEPLKSPMLTYDRTRIQPETGEEMTVAQPVLTLSRLSLERVPKPGETWTVRIQESPTSLIMVDYIISPTRASEGGQSLEIIRLYLQKLEQSP